jgi:hypothetical protein
MEGYRDSAAKLQEMATQCDRVRNGEPNSELIAEAETYRFAASLLHENPACIDTVRQLLRIVSRVVSLQDVELQDEYHVSPGDSIQDRLRIDDPTLSPRCSSCGAPMKKSLCWDQGIAGHRWEPVCGCGNEDDVIATIKMIEANR